MSKNTRGDVCQVCGAVEVWANTPRTVYACGSSDYDKRPGSFRQGKQCNPNPDYSKNTAECVEYVKTLVEVGRCLTVQDLFENASCVYLTRRQRIGLVWHILKTLFWK